VASTSRRVAGVWGGMAGGKTERGRLARGVGGVRRGKDVRSGESGLGGQGSAAESEGLGWMGLI
jgi:hypothetical protein